MALRIDGTSPPYQIIAEEEANAIFRMEADEVQTLHENINSERKLLEGVDVTDEETDEEKRLIGPGTMERLSLHRLRIGLLLNMTGNFTKRQLKSKYGCIYRLWQFALSILLVGYFLFAIGVLKIYDIKPVVVVDGNLPFTKLHDAVWELKWLLAFVLGTLYYGSGHIEKFLAGLSLPVHVYKKGKRHGWIYLLIIAFVLLLLPGILHGIQLYDLHKDHKVDKLAREIAVCVLLYIAFRVATVPSFCIVTMVLYLIKVQIDSLGQLLKCTNINLGVPYAKREIIAVKRKIRNTDSKQKWYLLCHMILVLITAFTGIFSCIERMHVSVGVNGTTSTVILKEKGPSQQHPKHLVLDLIRLKTDLHELRDDKLQDSTVNSDVGELRMHQLEERTAKLTAMSQRLLNITLQAILETKMRRLTPANISVNVRTVGGASQLIVNFLERTGPFLILTEAIIALIEVIVLFLVPLMLLSWHERAIQRITEEIQDLDMEDQRRFGFLIYCQLTQDDIIKALKKMRGVSIFGMRVSFYKAAFISMLAPFIAVLFHFIFKKYGFY